MEVEKKAGIQSTVMAKIRISTNGQPLA